MGGRTTRISPVGSTGPRRAHVHHLVGVNSMGQDRLDVVREGVEGCQTGRRPREERTAVGRLAGMGMSGRRMAAGKAVMGGVEAVIHRRRRM